MNKANYYEPCQAPSILPTRRESEIQTELNAIKITLEEANKAAGILRDSISSVLTDYPQDDCNGPVDPNPSCQLGIELHNILCGIRALRNHLTETTERVRL